MPRPITLVGWLLLSGCQFDTAGLEASSTSEGSTSSSSTSAESSEGSATSQTSSTGEGTTTGEDTTTSEGTTGGPNSMGCADGQREGFSDLKAHPDIAGCAGGFSMAGVDGAEQVHCDREAGDDSSNPQGDLCGIEDLCALGWHVCRSSAEVAARAPRGCQGATTAADPPLFFATRQSGPGNAMCGDGSDDVFGCGSLGAPGLDTPSCAPLDRFSDDHCWALPVPWICDDVGNDEASVIRKPGPDGGGVLCCRDSALTPAD